MHVFVCTEWYMCVAYSSEQDAVIAEQMQSAEMVNREHERMQNELKDEVSSFIDIICTYLPKAMNSFSGLQPLVDFTICTSAQLSAAISTKSTWHRAGLFQKKLRLQVSIVMSLGEFFQCSSSETRLIYGTLGCAVGKNDFSSVFGLVLQKH